jgi:hypothetical protein
MENTKKASISAALIVVLCFFLPWVQVSCGGAKDTLSGVDLAREGHGMLWLIPLLMIIAVGFSFMRSWKSKLDLGALLSFVAGLVSAYLMNRERTRAEDSLVAVQVTGWFWLGLGASIVAAVAGAITFLRPPKPS